MKIQNIVYRRMKSVQFESSPYTFCPSKMLCLFLDIAYRNVDRPNGGGRLLLPYNSFRLMDAFWYEISYTLRSCKYNSIVLFTGLNYLPCGFALFMDSFYMLFFIYNSILLPIHVDKTLRLSCSRMTKSASDPKSRVPWKYNQLEEFWKMLILMSSTQSTYK